MNTYEESSLKQQLTANLFLSLSRLDQYTSEFGEMQMNKWYLPMSPTDYTHWSLRWLFRFSKMTGSDLPYHLCLLPTIFWTFRIIILFQCHLWKLLRIWTLLHPLQLSPAAHRQNFLLIHQAKMWVQSSCWTLRQGPMDWASAMDPHPTAVYSVKDLEYQEREQLKDSELVLQISQADMEQTLVGNPDHNKHCYLLYLRVLT